MIAAAGRRNPGSTSSSIEWRLGRRPVDSTICLHSFYLAEGSSRPTSAAAAVTPEGIRLLRLQADGLCRVDGVLSDLREAGSPDRLDRSSCHGGRHAGSGAPAPVRARAPGPAGLARRGASAASSAAQPWRTGLGLAPAGGARRTLAACRWARSRQEQLCGAPRAGASDERCVGRVQPLWPRSARGRTATTFAPRRSSVENCCLSCVAGTGGVGDVGAGSADRALVGSPAEADTGRTNGCTQGWRTRRHRR
jgi:hypothetical protein